jgi:predicted ATPase
VLATAQRLATIEPLHEEVQAWYLAVLERTGRRAAALERYDQIRARLSNELGVEPGPELAAVRQQLLRGRRSAVDRPISQTDAIRPPWRGRGPGLGRLIQRDSDMEHVAGLLTRRRLTTLAGPPGCGKSALALHTAARLRDRFPAGVVVADAADLADRSALTRHVLDLLGAPPGADLATVVGEQEMLLLFDNVEHMVDDCALAVEQVVRNCRHVSVMVTSREPLCLPCETVWRVQPLPIPDPETMPWPGDNPAVGLFAERAAQVRPGFRVEQHNIAAVATICRCLDGLPLALELAAACLATDSLDGLVCRLDDPLRKIHPRRRGMPAHHRSLRTALLRSLDCLEAVERWLFQRLGDLPVPFDLETVRQACEPVPWPDADLAKVLSRLVDKSLLLLTSGPDGPSYRMLRVIQRLAVELHAEADLSTTGG